jgi:hypothetical protein
MAIHPITVEGVATMMMDDYGLTPADAYTATRTLMTRLEKRGLQVIRGEWVQPEVVVVERGPAIVTQDDRWMSLASKVTHETAGREPWRSPELR